MRAALATLALVAAALVGCDDVPPNDRWQPAPHAVTSATVDAENARHARAAEGSTTPHQLDPDASRGWLFAALYLPLGTLALASAFLMWNYRRRQREAEAWREEAALTDGERTVAGVVETDDTRDAITLSVEQEGSEWVTKQGYTHRRTEVRREVVALPFTLRTKGGQRVRVEPGERIELRDKLNHTDRLERNLRRRVAKLKRGERAWVTGTLSGTTPPSDPGGYRSADTVPVLRPSEGEALYVTTETPGAFEAERGSLHRRWLVRIVATVIALHLTVLFNFSALATLGSVTWEPVVATAQWQVWMKPKNQTGYWAPRHALRVRTADGSTWESPCGEALYRCASWGACERVPVLSAPPGLRQFGERAKLFSLQVIALFFVVLVLYVAYPYAALSTRPWYARRKVNDRGRGTLSGDSERV